MAAATNRAATACFPLRGGDSFVLGMDRLSGDVFDGPLCDEVVVMRMPSVGRDEGRGVTGRVREASPTLLVARAVRLAREEEEGVGFGWIV